jgi:asparagine synthase (glutamine-hydrolysing)
MCGIFGILSPDVSKVQLEAATNTLRHRGPDDSGFYFDENIALGQRRLSIIDLEGGHQPIFNEDGSKCVIFNGEIYNFIELTQLLVAKGHRFSTRSDTETILHAYEEWGEACVEHFRGMFAFAIWDGEAKTLFLARDRLGIKPLFYAEHNGTFAFASEMKAILADNAFPREIDDLALASYFSLSYIPDSLTIFRHIRKLPPGHTLTHKDGTTTIRKYWDLFFVPDYTESEAFFIQRFMELLQEAIRIRLISEVPLGAFLSGGIDSSTVVALMSKALDAPANTFCIGFGGEVSGYLDERHYARVVSERYGTNHREYEVLPRAEGLVQKIVTAFDEPFADDSAIPSYFVCETARRHVTVALSGLGGDEVFGGYERYLGFTLARIYKRIPRFLRRGFFQTFIESLPERTDGHYTVNHMKRFVRSDALDPATAYFGYLSKISPRTKDSFFSEPEKYKEHFAACYSLFYSYFTSPNVADDKSSLNRPFYCDIKTYLPEDILAVTDRMSMYHALEVRVPLLDHKFVEFCATIPPEVKIKWWRKKYLLRKAVSHLLPREVLSHRKQGFAAPMAQWLKRDLKSYTVETLSEKNLKKHDLFDRATVKKILDEHFSGKEIHDTLIWSLLIFQTWFDMYMAKRPV